MDAMKVTTRDVLIKNRLRSNKRWRLRWWWLVIAAIVIIAAAALIFKIITATPAPTEAPEAGKILKAQESTANFGILIPAYLPHGFDRTDVDVSVNRTGPAGEPAADVVYRGKNNSFIFIHQWVPANPDLETLNGSRVIETKWGKSWLLTQGTDGLIAVWVDIGPLRVSLSSSNRDVISREQLVLSAETLGLASNLQAYSFASTLPQIKDMAPPPPFEVSINDSGIQEFNLVITPGGYSPMRFAVKRGIPVKLNFRAMGQVGCGNTLIFPADTQNPTALTLKSSEDLKILEFTPAFTGDFQFECTNNCYRGVMTVRPAG